MTFQGVQVVVEPLEVFKVLSSLLSRSLTLQFRKVYLQDRVQLRWRRRTLTFQFRVVAVRTQIFLQQLRLLVCRIRQINGVFALFPGGKKGHGWARTPGRNWVRTLVRPHRLLI